MYGEVVAGNSRSSIVVAGHTKQEVVVVVAFLAELKKKVEKETHPPHLPSFAFSFRFYSCFLYC